MTTYAWPPERYWGAWLLAGTYNFLQFGLGEQWKTALAFAFSHFFVWSLLGLAILPLARHFPLRRRWQGWAFHLVAGSLFTVTDILLGHLLFSSLTGVHADLAPLDLWVMGIKSCIHLGLLTYWGFIGIVSAWDWHQLARQRELQIATQQTELVRTQLHSLKIQLQPHFLFNTLHSIGAMMREDMAGAERMLARLGDLLRRSLQDGDAPTVTLAEELAFTQAYLDIEGIRFGQRLTASCDLPDALRAHPVPPFILQPLVENAIKHAVAPRAEGGNIAIRAYIAGQHAVVEVRDDAPDSLAAQKGFGLGLRNTRERLDTLYGAQVLFELAREGRYTVARIRMPLRAGAPAQEAQLHDGELHFE